MFPPVRSAPLWLALVLGLPALAATPDDALRAADPASPTAALPLLLPAPQRLDAPEQPADLDRARAVWREANQRVAEFPRGHIDLLRWEATNARTAPAASPAASPAAPLGLAEALRASLRQRPDLFTHAGMNEPARARVRVAYAAHVRDVQQAWIDAVATHERLQLRSAVLDASRSGSELGQRMVQAGNWPAARLLQERLIESAAWQAQADATLAAHAALERLAGLMGLWRADEVRALGERLGAGLPALPATPGDGLADSGIEAAVLRADPMLALEAVPAQRAFAGLPPGRWAAWEGVREAAIAALPDPGGAAATPPHINDQALLREHRLLEADEHRARLLARASERRAMARSAWAQLQARHAGALHAERVLARLKDAQQQETLLRYNGMFDSTWQLLASARERLDALDAALMARRGYWRAQASWRALLAGAGFAMDDMAAAASPAGGNEAGATDMNLQRRQLFAGAAGAVAAASVSRVALAALPEAPQQTSADTAAPWTPPGVSGAGRPYNPVVTLNGWTLPWRMNNGVKEFHLVAEPVVREVAPGFHVNMWGYNGQSPGPTIEVVEGDRVRIYVTNRLPEHTTIHWHGQRLPNGMDGVGGLNQPQIPVGKTFVYEFVARRPGTFMYHPHADEMVQMAMGMMGFWVTHPKQKHPLIDEVQRDYCFLLNAFDVTPGSRTPQVNTMLEHNIWCWNSRVFPGITPLVARLGDKVRVRVGNLTMTNHPIHIHGIEFEVTGTDGGPTPKGSRWPEVTADVAVGQMRQLEFVADEPGDWAMHCHKSHHTMGAMGHGVPTMIGVDHRGLVKPLQKSVPDYMVMGERGMADMGEMQMELPANTFPMMTGSGPYGPIEMGGMFTTLKVRADQKPGDYKDPGDYAMPAGTQARAVDTAGAPMPSRAAPAPATPKPAADARKPGGHSHH